MEVTMTYPELKKLIVSGKYSIAKEAWVTGYISRRVTPDEYLVTLYKGRYGQGYKVHIPNDNSTTYHKVMYIVKTAEDK